MMLQKEKRERVLRTVRNAMDRGMVTPEEMMEFLYKMLKRHKRREAKLNARRSRDN